MESPLPGPTRCDMRFLSLGYHFPDSIDAGISFAFFLSDAR
jgi:hypothetical protein